MTTYTYTYALPTYMDAYRMARMIRNAGYAARDDNNVLTTPAPEEAVILAAEVQLHGRLRGRGVLTTRIGLLPQ